MIFIYNTVLFILFLPAMLFLMLRYRRRFAAEFFYRYRERLGTWKMPAGKEDTRPLLWFHCASLGEARAAEPLIRELKDFRILLTTVTFSGREYARTNSLGDLLYYAPLDFSFLVAKAVSPLKPRGLVLVETELWPGMIAAAKKAGAKVVLANGRLSSHSYPFYRDLSFFWKPVLGRIDHLCARSPEDAERFVSIGFPESRAEVTGNIKYDRTFPATGRDREEFRLAAADTVWVCGSTRPGEEEILAGVFNALRKKYASLKLVIAPRHVERARQVAALLDRNHIRSSLRSRPAAADFECLVVDTFGELQALYALSDLAFVGGSLVDKGGQNPIEPAAFSKPV
ncbi:MAG: 3-deoxy-D-manno-octulosonic acid transferase, partial [Endomicrobiales bacterium]